VTASAYSILGLEPGATAEEIRAARRTLAMTHHPDVGGDADEMQRINNAAGQALRLLSDGSAPARHGGTDASTMPERAAEATSTDPSIDDGWIGDRRDAPSFVVEALPVEAYHALTVAAAELGEIADDDPPYVLRCLLGAPLSCWCQLDLVPDAGASTVSVAIAELDDAPLPPLLAVRNAWIAALNDLDWATL
jgi:hypothetical protein